MVSFDNRDNRNTRESLNAPYHGDAFSLPRWDVNLSNNYKAMDNIWRQRSFEAENAVEDIIDDFGNFHDNYKGNYEELYAIFTENSVKTLLNNNNFVDLYLYRAYIKFLDFIDYPDDYIRKGRYGVSIIFESDKIVEEIHDWCIGALKEMFD